MIIVGYLVGENPSRKGGMSNSREQVLKSADFQDMSDFAYERDDFVKFRS